MNASAEERKPTTLDPPTISEHVFMVLPTPEAVRSMRHRARTILEAEDLPEDTVQDALVVMSELTTNALCHALPPAYLRLSVPVAEGCRIVRIEVTDSGRACHAHLSSGYKDPEEHGRGLEIVNALSTRCGSRAQRSRSVRWAELTAPRDSPAARAPSGPIAGIRPRLLLLPSWGV
ncbi:ATP-binding protein [Streptomyces aquilus]|uniref:ATP-binding protein n=1 Tax=Streptomyces aquilus TaxID=2548456 RepID=A0A3Q9BVI9_9ACTN|nr:ATP-binding protein [Streptomyces aquilus]AZP14797.1 ATP-binding protein [Streptomyces aquilus]